MGWPVASDLRTQVMIWFRRFAHWMSGHPLVGRIGSALLFGFGLFVSRLIDNQTLLEAGMAGLVAALVFGTVVYPRFGKRRSAHL